jgi:hypothetical protein
VANGDRLIRSPWRELEGVELFLNLPHMLSKDSFSFNSTKVSLWREWNSFSNYHICCLKIPSHSTQQKLVYGGVEFFLNLPHMLSKDSFSFNSTKVSLWRGCSFSIYHICCLKIPSHSTQPRLVEGGGRIHSQSTTNAV